MPHILISIGSDEEDFKNYTAAVAAAGGTPHAAYLPPANSDWDGLVLAGGNDMDPAFFGQENRGSRGIDRARDRAELALLNAFFGQGKPVLAICRGHQVANVWLGGTLVQGFGEELRAFHSWENGDKVHAVRALPGSLLHRMYGEIFLVNSAHHQGLGRLGKGLVVTARSESGVAEALEHKTLPLIATQFHPERMTGAHIRPDTVDGGKLFEAFMARCGGK